MKNEGRTTDRKLFHVHAVTPVAMDASQDGRLFAVLEEGRDHVKLYRHGNAQPHAIYRGYGEAFKPVDVCFFSLGGRERLLVADWSSDSLHVLDFSSGEGCELIGRVGGWDCPALTQPTALCPDTEGRLWIGCQGGLVLTLRTLP